MQQRNWKKQLYEVIYEADTAAGKWFDIVLLFLIGVSIALVMLESVASIEAHYGDLFLVLEWIITILFSIEYILRIVCIKKPLKYVFSFYGIIDFISTIPLYLSYFFVGSHVLIAFRALRLLRVFRILKLVRFLGEAAQLKEAIRASRTKILVFIYTVLIISVILGTIMYLVEGAESGFTSIPRSIYWTIVTLTTVGYGDIAPATNLGQFLASLIMILGYGIIAVPTGIVTVEFAKQSKVQTNTQVCSNCHKDDHRDEAEYCYNCGEKL
ncbi:ion transporter [Neptunitalea lumnitzerae]|uniref:Ion transporter n=1 Tax=Neptunitalea lumnitzerae TaxID=2965509 RepID=A0ABQ5MKZ6_9FLAO|nr:ion transporter [Neptunitalea sp. Y10]GLB49730.1 ion transporter [Neptunitalea sp. Y10]